MGQYGNQPDFGTRAAEVTPTGDNFATGQKLNSAALYIGTGGTLVCNVVGNDPNDNDTIYTTFKNIPNGTFFPVIVDYVFVSDGGDDTTTCADIIALY
jgi:hypothetical protein